MNELRKKIVYNYIIITIILLVVEWNVFHLFEIYLPSVSQHSGISAELIKAFGLLAVMMIIPTHSFLKALTSTSAESSSMKEAS